MTLEIITSDQLAPLKHGFFTRRGGASSGVFAGLNCGLGSSDQAEMVAINRSRAAQALGVTAEDMASVHQIHSAEVLTVDAPVAGQRPKADALVPRPPGVALAILTADCQPVLFADLENRVIGAAHAGWRGALTGVLEHTLEAMEALGADRRAIKVTIGPSISQRAYEVGPEFMQDFLTNDGENLRFFTRGREDRLHFDLPAYGLHRLERAGVDAEWTRHCTYSEPDRFYSFRRSTHLGEVDYGRLISMIRL